MNTLTSEQIDDIRHQMVKFAMLQLADKDLAKDVVQEALTNAYKYAESFRHEAALKTWIFAILKNKIVDLIKKQHKLVPVSELCEEETQEAFFMTAF